MEQLNHVAAQVRDIIVSRIESHEYLPGEIHTLGCARHHAAGLGHHTGVGAALQPFAGGRDRALPLHCLLYTSDAADE